MEEKKYLISKEGLEAIKAEYADRKEKKRKEISKKIGEARAQGDLSENAEYDAAMDEQRDNEARIKELEDIIKNAQVVEHGGDSDNINIGSQVKVLDVEENEELDYQIVGSIEANSLMGKISNVSPLGSALIGKTVGDEVTVETESGSYVYRIIGVEKHNGSKE